MNNKIAQVSTPLGNLSGVGEIGQGSQGVSLLERVLSTVIGLLTIIGVLYFLFVLITGAIGIISSGGDKGAYEDAKKKITTGFIGLVVVIAALFIMDIVATLLGIPDILNLTGVIANIRL